MTLKEEYAQSYWQLANLVTGFAIAEALATLFAVGNGPRFAEGIRQWRWVVIPLTAVAHSIYCAAVYYCCRQELRLLPEDESEIREGTYAVFAARAVSIIVFGVLLIAITLAIPPQADSAHNATKTSRSLIASEVIQLPSEIVAECGNEIATRKESGFDFCPNIICRSVPLASCSGSHDADFAVRQRGRPARRNWLDCAGNLCVANSDSGSIWGLKQAVAVLSPAI